MIECRIVQHKCRRSCCHCERSEAIQRYPYIHSLDCFTALPMTPVAMTGTPVAMIETAVYSLEYSNLQRMTAMADTLTEINMYR
jgi:hypothetical protein